MTVQREPATGISQEEIQSLPPRRLRRLMCEDRWRRPTAGLAPGHAQANLVVLPLAQAYDFLLFCQRNPKPCPLLEVTDVGSPYSVTLAEGADLRTDLPLYRVYRNGVLCDEVPEIAALWRKDLVAFLLGCSFTFEDDLLRAGLPVRHLEEGHNVPMYITDVPCARAGVFSGPTVVTMRPYHDRQVPAVTVITARYAHVHGAPLHIGDPAAIGIQDLARPDFGEASSVREGETPVFWACGVTAQAVAVKSKPPLMITHAPGHMFVSDRLNGEFLNL